MLKPKWFGSRRSPFYTIYNSHYIGDVGRHNGSQNPLLKSICIRKNKRKESRKNGNRSRKKHPGRYCERAKGQVLLKVQS